MTRDIEDPDLVLAEMFHLWPETASVFLNRKMLCVGCLIGPFHTVVDACREYGLEEDSFRAELRRAITTPSGDRPR